MSSVKESEQLSLPRLAIGVSVAAVHGLLIALWVLATKGFATADPSVGHYILVFAVSGVIYFCLAALVSTLKKDERKLKLDTSVVLILSCFSVISLIQFGIGVWIFEFPNAEIAISSILRNTSLIFIALFCHLSWILPQFIPERRLSRKVFFGISLFLVACWMYVGSPISYSSWYAALSIWGALSLLMGFNIAITETLSFAMTQKTNSFTMHLGVGIVLFVVGVCCFPISFLFFSFEHLSVKGYAYLFAVSAIIPVAQGFRFIALSLLKDIIGKKGIGIWSFLFFTFVFSVAFYGEPVSGLKVLGLLLALLAVVLLEPGLNKMIFQKR